MSELAPPEIRPTTPRDRLDQLAHNLWWSWDTEATSLFASIDPFRWARNGHNPIALLLDIDPELRDRVLTSPAFLDRLDRVWMRFRAYLGDRSWVDAAAPEVQRGGVAYFSMEFGLHQALRLYSGGLGVLAGDHLRSASDLGVPLIGVSLLYRQGYFQQMIALGQQLTAYAPADWDRLPVVAWTDGSGRPITVSVPMGDRVVVAKVWSLAVGRCRLLLLDTDHEDNPDEARAITRSLYSGDDRMRIRQEVLLGIGGVAALQAVGLDPAVYHLNEGHCAFVPLALAARHGTGAAFTAGLTRAAARCVFTTHTPVPAGHDRFSPALVEEILGPWWTGTLGQDPSQLLALGRIRATDDDETLCMTLVALRTTTAANGVSALHGTVSREMWRDAWPDRDPDDIPIGHVTNGVHPVFWMAPTTRRFFDRHLPGWRNRMWDRETWARIDRVPAEELWALRSRLRYALVDQIRARTGRSFHPEALTLGFARRFATYKRGDLLFSDPDRLEALLDRGPMQVVFAGKAHPADRYGQQILANIVRWSESTRFRDRIVLIPDYDMALGALLTQGCDLWLNTPRRPHEASGTSGQKVCLNGGLNLSVLDGWWPEGFDGTNGFGIGIGQDGADPDAQDRADAVSLYRTLEEQVLPAWRDTDTAGMPRGWLARVRASIRTCVPEFNSHRMVRDYTLQMYAPRCAAPVPTDAPTAPVSAPIASAESP